MTDNVSDNVCEKVRFGPFEADLHTHELWKDGTRIKLVGQPFAILTVLLSKPGKLVTREELRSRLWPGDSFGDFNHGLNAAVNKLREALCDSAEEPKYIETLPRRGYRFIATIEQIETKEVTSEPSKTEPVIREQSVTKTNEELFTFAHFLSQEETEPEPQTRPRWLIVLTSGLVFLGVLVLLLIWFSPSRASKKTPPIARGPSRPPVPITALTDSTSDPTFSPDGTRIAFRRQGYAPGTSGIFAKAIGSSQIVQLTNNSEDCCPVWSPDGRSIAFSRSSGMEDQIYRVSANGGPLQKLYSTQAGSRRGNLDWSPNGEYIAFAGQSLQGTSSIFLLSFKNLTARRITEPPLLNNDWGPAFSPDGESLVFVRTRETGLPENIVVMPTMGGEVRVLQSWYNGILGPPTWAADGQSILFAAGAEPQLGRVSVSTGQTVPIIEPGSPAWHPAISRSGDRLAYQKVLKSVSVWQLDLTDHDGPHRQSVVVTEVGRNEGAQVSPDGKKLVFMSGRAGKMDIWISDRDGSNPRQLTDMGDTGTPHWSPDGRSIVFDAGWRDHGAVFIVDVAGAPRPLVSDNHNNLVPNWSRNGKWVYFASDRSGTWQVWKVSAQGGVPVQVTAHGGFAAYESGGVLYYSKHNMPGPEVWRMPVEGGTEALLSPLVRPETWASWAPVDRGVYFIENDINVDARGPIVRFFDFTSGQVTRKATLDQLPFWLSVSPNGKSLLYEHLDQENSHVMLLENFR